MSLNTEMCLFNMHKHFVVRCQGELTQGLASCLSVRLNQGNCGRAFYNKVSAIFNIRSLQQESHLELTGHSSALTGVLQTTFLIMVSCKLRPLPSPTHPPHSL